MWPYPDDVQELQAVPVQDAEVALALAEVDAAPVPAEDRGRRLRAAQRAPRPLSGITVCAHSQACSGTLGLSAKDRRDLRSAWASKLLGPFRVCTGVITHASLLHFKSPCTENTPPSSCGLSLLSSW